jgi:hypothetical protein
MYKVTYYLGRRERDTAYDADGKYGYEIWVLAELQSAEAAPPLQPSVDRELSPESASDLGKHLKAAIDDVAAGRVEGIIWKIDDLSEGQVARLVDLPDRLPPGGQNSGSGPYFVTVTSPTGRIPGDPYRSGSLRDMTGVSRK